METVAARESIRMTTTILLDKDEYGARIQRVRVSGEGRAFATLPRGLAVIRLRRGIRFESSQNRTLSDLCRGHRPIRPAVLGEAKPRGTPGAAPNAS